MQHCGVSWRVVVWCVLLSDAQVGVILGALTLSGLALAAKVTLTPENYKNSTLL